MSKIKTFFRLNICQFFYWNFIAKSVHRDKGCYIMPEHNTIIDIDKTANLYLHANLHLNVHEMRKQKRESYIFLRQNSSFTVNGKITTLPGSTIQVQKGGMLEMGKTYMNYGSTILAAYNMKIGDGILISRNVTIFDSDHHKIFDKDGKCTNEPREFNIGNHVWIGISSCILRGSQIGDGAVIAANSVVGGKIRPNTMASGNPARSYSEIFWEE